MPWVHQARLTHDPVVRSVLDMTTVQCEDCGSLDSKTELHEYRGPRRQRFMLPRCVDRPACLLRQKAEQELNLLDLLGEVSEVASDLAAERQAVKESEKRLAQAVKSALKEGAPVSGVARAAGLSRERVYQIRDDRR